MLWQILACCSSLFSPLSQPDYWGNLLLRLLIIFVKAFGVQSGKVYRRVGPLSWALPLHSAHPQTKHFTRISTLATQYLVVSAFSGKQTLRCLLNSDCPSSLGDNYMPQINSQKGISSVLCPALFLLEAKCLNRWKMIEKKNLLAIRVFYLTLPSPNLSFLEMPAHSERHKAFSCRPASIHSVTT